MYISEFLQSNNYIEEKNIFSKYINIENHYREIFANPEKDPNNECLKDPYCLCINVFDNINAFKFKTIYDDEEKVPRLFVLKEVYITGYNAVCKKEIFKSNFNIITEDMFEDFNWNNVVAAGGSVLAGLSPDTENFKTRRDKCNYYHENEYNGIDVDLFIYGLNEEDAKNKVIEICKNIENNTLFPIRYVRTPHSITIVNQYPFVNIQIILRLYKTPAEIIMGFDIDCCAVLYNGEDVYALPRSHHAIVSQYNTIDMTRRSPTYESRLAKYASRGYEVLYPELKRDKIDPTIYSKSFDELHGLDRLLVLEKNNNLRNNTYNRSDYSNVYFPWGINYTAKKVGNKLRINDYILNSDWYKGKGDRDYHIHPCFVGLTIEEIMKDKCGKCPPYPKDMEEILKDKYVRGELKFITDNPGKQFIGSFHQITEGDWTEGAYNNDDIEDFLKDIYSCNIHKIKTFLEQNPNFEINSADVLGRNCLIINAYNGNCDILDILLEHNVNINSVNIKKLSAFHISCMFNHHKFLEKLLEYNSKLNPNDIDENKKQYDITNQNNRYSKSPIELAILLGYTECVELLFKYNCPITLLTSDYHNVYIYMI